MVEGAIDDKLKVGISVEDIVGLQVGMAKGDEDDGW